MLAARFAPLLRTRVVVQTAPGFQAIRSISATAPYNKGPIDVTKETLKKADRTVSNVAVKGINTGEKAANKIKDVVGAGTKQAREKGEEVKGEASEYAGRVKGEAAEYAGKGKGKAEEALSEAKEKMK
ncbi:LEA domain protein [Penicillium digitatum]|uniref:LEA domain protein n=3 Tax=Penicillium digitatum TaxID=36651 RepID=K9FCT8_PEND2|nr:hypothetical protein PDIP_29440 [Penicillium digitatum Pd1]EKV05912.1 hypothetical protein PDIG_81090 [Penicillium digitatum PHI26]EKV17840.1 hypothetical protein PDIP_29440 [Penicillium digitatum Pd1]QQK46954.1 LEA domain protein [Penicillium digitatum]